MCLLATNSILNMFISLTLLEIVQHPVRARCCGFGEKDRRSLDPPPIIELTAEDINGQETYLK
jgi:hypothetical protein